MSGISYLLTTNNHFQVSFFEVGFSNESNLTKEVNRFLHLDLTGILMSKTYCFVHERKVDLSNLASSKPFLDPALNSCSYNTSLALKTKQKLEFNFLIQAGLKPGTSDAEGMTALEQAFAAAKINLTGKEQGFLITSYYLQGSLTAEQKLSVSKFLFNPELYESQIITSAEFYSGKNVLLPVVELQTKMEVQELAIANFSDEQLLELNSERKLAATIEELKYFQSVYKNPEFVELRTKLGLTSKATDVELETWFGLRSEHCFHKEFNARIILDVEVDSVFQNAINQGWLKEVDNQLVLERGMFKTFIKDPAFAVNDRLTARGCNWISSMFSDNSGVVYYDQDYMYCLKVETHNSPSNIEPVQGAKTGLNGNFRDIMGTMQGTFDILMGFFCYCTGNPNYQGWLPKGVKHPYLILKGITRGIREAGNEMQIPTLNGLVFSDPRYIAKCLVYAGAVGWSPVKSVTGYDYRTKEPSPGDQVLIAGQAVGIDGIHGATESSLSASSEISLGHVQADFSFIQVKVKEFILDASRQGLFTAVTDLGAMGLGSASHEIARSTNGLVMDLAKHPVKYQGIQPWQINCSETQDRMLLVSHPRNLEKIKELASFYEIELSNVGHLENNNLIQLKYQDKLVGLFQIDYLFSSEPRKVLKGKWHIPAKQNTNVDSDITDLNTDLAEVLAHPDVASKEWFFRQKDFSVKGGTIIAPLFGKKLNVDSDATLQKPLDTIDRDYGALAYAMAAAPKLADLDPYYSVQKSYYDLLGKIIAIGGVLPDLNKASWDAWAVCGNYCQPNSDSDYTMDKESGLKNCADLVREGIAVAELVQEFNIPIISGKDSMKCSCTYEVDNSFDLQQVPYNLRKQIKIKALDNGNKKIEIHDPATYLISGAVKIQDYRKCQNASFKYAGDLVYLVQVDDAKGFAGSAWEEVLNNRNQENNVGSYSPITTDAFKFIAEKLANCFEEDILASSAYVHSGGLLTSIFKSLVSSELGMDLNLSNISQPLSETLFSERPGRFVISINPINQSKLEKIFTKEHLIPLGKVTESGLEVITKKQSWILDLAKLEESYHQTYNFGAK